MATDVSRIGTIISTAVLLGESYIFSSLKYWTAFFLLPPPPYWPVTPTKLYLTLVMFPCHSLFLLIGVLKLVPMEFPPQAGHHKALKNILS